MLRWLLVAVVALSFGAIGGSFLLAGVVEGGPWWLPSISETADFEPARSFFTFLMSLAMLILSFVIMIRHVDLLVHAETRMESRLIYGATISGLLVIFGLLIVASYQQAEAPLVHYPAAVILFHAVAILLWFNAILGLQMRDRRPIGKALLSLRFFLAILQSFGLLWCASCSLIWYLQSHQPSPSEFWWNLNALGEYIMAASLGIFWLSLLPDYGRLKIEIKAHHLPTPPNEQSPLLN